MTSSKRYVRPLSSDGFTLIELLVVITIIALLVAIMAPSLTNILNYVKATICRNNLHQLATTLRNKHDGSSSQLPYAGSWYSFITERGGVDLLLCPGDEEEHSLDTSDVTDLSEVYVVQNCTLFTNLQHALDTGYSPVDPQVLVNPPGIAGDHNWDPPDPREDQALICIDDDAAFMVTFGDNITIDSIDPPGDGGLCWSEHWIVVDDGSPNFQAEVEAILRSVRNSPTPGPESGDPRIVMRLTGRNYGNIVEPTYTVYRQNASYGMSTAVSSVSPGAGQLMLVEYRTSVVYADQNYANIDRYLRPRHLGKANYALTDGSVEAMTAEELEWQFDSTPGRGIWGTGENP